MTYIWETISVPHFPLYTSKWTAVGLNKLFMINPTVSFQDASTNLKLTLSCYVCWVDRQCQAGEQNKHSYEAILEDSWQLIFFEGLCISSCLQSIHSVINMQDCTHPTFLISNSAAVNLK